MPNDPITTAQYRAAKSMGGFLAREDRGLIQVSGADRAGWLNNLVTNAIKTLRPGEGRYAFACDARGRTIADLNVFVLEDRLWLDVDRRWIVPVLAHLTRHTIVEDVVLTDLSSQTRRLAVLGTRANDVVRRLELGDITKMAPLQHLGGRLGDEEVRMARNDFAGPVAAEFFILSNPDTSAGEDEEPPAQAGADSCGGLARRILATACSDLGLTSLDRPVVEVLRIEAGIPASIDDIDDEVLPPETGQIDRGIDYHKGCYLGQEVIERMRSHGVLARRLVGLRIDGDAIVAPRSPIRIGENQIGRTRSCCWSERLGAVLALGYVKTAYAEAGVEVMIGAGEHDRAGTVVELPVREPHASAS